jgi:hypothetical protein
MRIADVAGWLLAGLACAGCTVPSRTGWETRLRHRLGDVSQRFDAGRAILSGLAPAASSASERPLDVGDQLLFGVALERGATGTTWYLRIEVAAIERHAGEVSWARIRVDAFDGEARALASADTWVAPSQLQWVYAACQAGARQQLRRRGREQRGDEGGVPPSTADAQADARCVALGAGACHLLFRLLRTNPVTRDILYEVVALPTLWSIVSTMRVKAGLTVDYLAAQRVDPANYPGAQRPLWSVPAVVLLNEQPALYAHLVVGPDGAPDGAAAGVFAIVGRHPSDERRKVFVQLIASRRAVDELPVEHHVRQPPHTETPHTEPGSSCATCGAG